MDSIEKLTELFSKFPGIGPRQAKRFVYFVLYKNNGFAGELTKAITDLKKHVKVCKESFYHFYSENNLEELCKIERDKSRDTSLLMIVEKDIDLENIEKSGTYNGRYFILGGTVPILEKEPQKFVRSKELIEKVKTRKDLKEIIIATNANPDGEHTAEYLNEILKPFSKDIKISQLGRGLSTGTELEYSDTETLKNALKNRG